MARDIHAQAVPLPKFPMSAFDLGNSLKFCSSAGKMNCHYVEEVIPSDIAHIRTDLFIRLDPLTFPIMHKLKVRQNFFFVPTRLVLGDELTEEFFSCNDLGAKLSYFRADGNVLDSGTNWMGPDTLFDMMCGEPVTNPASMLQYVIPNPIPFYMYQLIWKDWFADEIFDATEIASVEASIQAYRSAGLNSFIQDDFDALDFRSVSYSKDRFTSAQPDAQRVGEVYLMNPLRTEFVDGSSFGTGLSLVSVGGTATSTPPGVAVAQESGGSYRALRASLTIDELWDEMAVQRFLNSLNEFGNERYVEILAGQFGVVSADARLQRPQWLGGNEVSVNISEVLQTSETSSSSPLGAFAGRGLVAGRGRDITFRVPEHGFILGIMTIVPENGYASGSPRWMFKQSPLDFAMPRFNNLGEQAVFAGELKSDHLETNSQDFNEFGYQPQYDEYRSHPSRSTMDFRKSAFLPWHLDRKFVSVPPLNDNFIHISPSGTNRIFNVADNADHYRIHAFHKAMYVRPISRHPVPGKL